MVNERELKAMMENRLKAILEAVEWEKKQKNVWKKGRRFRKN